MTRALLFNSPCGARERRQAPSPSYRDVKIKICFFRRACKCAAALPETTRREENCKGFRPDRSIGSFSCVFLTWSDSPVRELSSIFKSLPWSRTPSAGRRSPAGDAELSFVCQNSTGRKVHSRLRLYIYLREITAK